MMDDDIINIKRGSQDSLCSDIGDEELMESENEDDGTEDNYEEVYCQNEELGYSSYYPFPSKLFALLYILVNRPQPLVS